MSDNKKEQLIKAAASRELCPIPVEEDDEPRYKQNGFGLEDLAALGVGFDTVRDALINVFSEGTSGVYRVKVPAAGHLMKAKDGSGFIGTAGSDTNNQIMGQARLNPLECDPTMLFMAVALMNIQMKLNDIQETQEEILDILVQKEKAKIRGDLNFLTEVIANYKFNWDNKQYKNSNYIKALDIRQESERSIIFAKEQIEKELSKKDLIKTDQAIDKKLKKLQSSMSDYQLSVYLLGLSYYAEVLLQGNFDSGYLETITDKLQQFSDDYRVMYTKVYNELEEYKKGSLQGMLLKGVGKAGEGVGSVIGKIPLVNKTSLDEMVAVAGEKVQGDREKKDNDDLGRLIPHNNCNVKPFIDTIDMIDNLYNKTVEIAFDKDSIYCLETTEEEA